MVKAFNTEIDYNEEQLKKTTRKHVGDKEFKFKKLEDKKELRRLRTLEKKLEEAMPDEVQQPEGTPWDEAVTDHEREALAGRREAAKKAAAMAPATKKNKVKLGAIVAAPLNLVAVPLNFIINNAIKGFKGGYARIRNFKPKA